MGRPPGYQWQPLGLDTDPVPGDPQAISTEAAHLASVARTITGQIAAMRKIASDDTEVGQHAEKIRTTARSLAGSLQAVATRYAKVSSALSGWVPELEQAQSLSIRALNEAEAPYAQLSRAVLLPSGPDLTAAQKQEIASYHTSIQRAQDQLDTAKALLTRATNLRDTQGAHYAA
jgi:small-conductance mechanosensitive channel